MFNLPCMYNFRKTLYFYCIEKVGRESKRERDRVGDTEREGKKRKRERKRLRKGKKGRRDTKKVGLILQNCKQILWNCGNPSTTCTTSRP